MDKVDLVVWMIGGGFAINYALMIIMWNSLTSRIEKLDEKVTDIDRRLCRLEGAFTSKECCRIGDDRQMKKAE